MNVVVIVSDTLRRDHLGCYGSASIHTPHIDRLAGESTVFDRAFVSSFPTVPCRNDIMTGRYTFTYRPWSPVGAEELLLAEVLGRNGVVTYLSADTPNAFSPGYNYQRGFSGYEFIRGQESDPWRTTPVEVRLPCAPEKLRTPDAVRQYLRNVSERRSEEDYFPARTLGGAAAWLERHAGAGRRADGRPKPFFLYCDTFDPHEPWDPPAHYLALYERGYEGEEVIYPRYDRCDYLSPAELAHCRALYAGEVTMVDHWVGHLLAAIDRLGFRDDTAVILMSDHGFYHGEHGCIGKWLMTSRHAQGVPLYPEVCRVPFMLRVPGVTANRSDRLVQAVDIFPTVLDLFGIRADAPRVQGLSALGEQRRQWAVSSPTLSHPGIRVPHPATRATVSDGRWLLVYGSQASREEQAGGQPERTRMVDGIERVVRTLGSDPVLPELYDLQADAGCTRNLYGDAGGSEPARRLHAGLVEQLTRSAVPEEHLRFFRTLPG